MAEGAEGYATPETSSGDLPSANGIHAAAAMQRANGEAQDEEMEDEAMDENVGGPEIHRSNGDDGNESADEGDNGVTTSTTGPFPGAGEQSAVPVTHFRRRSFRTSGSTVGTSRKSFSDSEPTPFSPAVVASSLVSFLEILQLLTLQVHTLEECASLHRTQPELDDEKKLLSSGLSINSYLSRLIHVPESLVDEWSLRPFPDGPLPSKGSGENRGSSLGLFVALYTYKHRSVHGCEMIRMAFQILLLVTKGTVALESWLPVG